MSLNDTHSLERTLDFCDKSNDSFLNTTDCSIPNNISNISTVTTGCQSNAKAMSNQPQQDENKRKSHIHFNRLWSVWYGILVTLFQGYLIILGLQKYLGCSLLKWKNGLPVTELNMQLIFCSLTLLFLPLFLASALFKVGNLANDGIKLSARKGTCSSEQPVIFEDDGNSSTMRSLWMHGVPISVFIHIITALCLLLPHLLLEAKLIQNQHLPKDNIWKSEIDFILNRNDRLVILSFINTSPYQNDTATTAHENKYEDDDDDDLFESLDYDPHKTHESLKSYNTPTETYLPALLDSIPIRISTYADDYDLELENFPEKFTTTPVTLTTRRSTITSSITELPIKTTEKTSTERTTTIKLTTLSTTTESTPIPTTEEPTTTQQPTTQKTTQSTIISTTMKISTTPEIFTEEPTLPTRLIISTSPKTTLSTTLMPQTYPTQPTFATFPPIIEKVHHIGKGNKGHGKSRKHGHKKHHKLHPSPAHEIDDLPDDPNLEIKQEKDFNFESFDQDAYMIDNGNNRNTNRKKAKGSGNVKSASEQTRPISRNNEQIERPKTTQKTVTESTRQVIGKTNKARDSEIHIVKSPETASSTSSSFIPHLRNDEYRMRATDVSGRRVVKRSISEDGNDEDDILLLDSVLPSINEDVYVIKEEKLDEIYPAALIGAVTNFTQSNELDGVGGFIQSILGTDDKFDPKHWFQKSPNLEYLNLALALLVWSVRYPSVFWDSSKAFTMIFSLQMLINSIDILMLHVGTSILFKLEIVGQFMPVQNQPSPLLLNGIVTLALTLLAYVLIIASSMILYLYGHSRLSAKIRDCQMITLKDGDLWSYFSHCASLCFILAISVVKAPIIHDLSVVYRISLDKTIFAATMTSIIHIFLWIVIWLALTAKRQWAFKLPLVESIYQTRAEAVQPLLNINGRPLNGPKKEEETIYWPSSPKLKVTFTDEVASTLTDRNLIPDIIEHDGKRSILSTICPNGNHSGEADEGEYATLKTTTQLQISEYDEVINLQRIQRNSNDNGYDDTSEEGKLLECVRDESVTYASTRDLEPPHTTTATVYSHERYIVSSDHHMISPMAPVTVQVHSEHLTSTPRFLRRADSGMPATNNEALTPKSDTNSTESSTSPPERALSESSSGVHSSEENKDEVLIRAKPGIQKPVKAPAVIEEEPYGRITNNHKMLSFKEGMNGGGNVGNNSNTLPHNRSNMVNEQPSIIDYSQCNTMPLMPGAHQIHRMSANDPQKQRTTLPNNIRYSTAGYHIRQMPQIKTGDSPYATTGLGGGHHTFSQRLIQNEPLPPPPIQQQMPQSHSQQQFSMTSSSSAIYQPIHHFNAPPSSFTGMVSHSSPYQMVVNELCANNQVTHSFPPPPPPISNSLQMH